MARHSAWVLGAIWLAACLTGMAGTSTAGDWQLIEQYPQINGFLSDRQPETQAFVNWEVYDEPTAKFYAVFELAMEENRALIVDIYSYEFQPILFVQDKKFQVLKRGDIVASTIEAGAELFHAHLEFHTPWAGPAELLISSEVPDQGGFAMEWSLWGSDGMPAATGGTSPLPPGTSECDCQDPATGRWYQSPFEDLGECRPERALKWCN